jgi:hypothetical protein
MDASAAVMWFGQPDGSIADNGVGIRPPHIELRYGARRRPDGAKVVRGVPSALHATLRRERRYWRAHGRE